MTLPLFEWTETVRPEWIDYNGHMNVAHYVAVFDRATEAFHASIGVDDAYRRGGASTFAVEQHIVYARELNSGARLRVTDLDTGRSVVVVVNDRGPFVRGRVVDVSLAAARRLGMVERGVARVRVERVPD